MGIGRIYVHVITEVQCMYHILLSVVGCFVGYNVWKKKEHYFRVNRSCMDNVYEMCRAG